jgi:ABC-type multidrug transport system fused ATPase/permease subunit
MQDSDLFFNYLKSFKKNIYLAIASNVMLSIFTVISIPVIIPFFQLLFGTQQKKEGGSFLELWLNNLFASIIQNYGKDKALVIVCVIIVIVFLFKNIFRYLALVFITPVRNGIVRDIRNDLFNKFLVLPISFYSEEKKGDLISRATMDVQEIEWSVLSTLDAFFKSPIVIVGCLFFMLAISLKLTIVVLVLLLFTALIIGGLGRSLRSTSSMAQIKLGELSSTLEESLSGMRVIKAFNAEETTKSKFNVENESYFDLVNKILYRRDLAAPLSEFLGIAVVVVLLWYGTSLVFKGELSPDTFFAYVFAFYQIIEPAKNFSQSFYNIQKGRSAMSRIVEILNFPIVNKDRPEAANVSGFNESIEFINVAFKYEGSDDYAIKNFNLTIKKGESVALVGSSGGGKSTIADLIIRFQEATEGGIFIDGKNILDTTLKSYRSLFGVVTQEAILFNDSIENNIVFGRSTDEKKLNEAIHNAYANEFINGPLDKTKFIIGDRGSKLSGGQKQRITIARAIYNNPEILILDEATSALDSESEKVVQQALEHIMLERTSIIIAHRLSTIKKADKIVVIKGGEILAIGKHEQLIETNEVYRLLVENQNI